jgi:hypothetical protein
VLQGGSATDNALALHSCCKEVLCSLSNVSCTASQLPPPAHQLCSGLQLSVSPLLLLLLLRRAS